MASVPEFSSDYSFSDNFTQFQNPLLIPQENCIHGTTPSSATSGEEISFPMFLDNGGFAVFQQEQRNLSPSVPTAVFPDNNVSSGCGFDGGYQLQDVLDEFGEECNRILHQDFKPVNMGDNWGVQGNRMVPAVQDNNHKVVRFRLRLILRGRYCRARKVGTSPKKVFLHSQRKSRLKVCDTGPSELIKMKP
ncbi:hypothetical protein F3Y22_tig00110893pilonHSYRG01358 [Hibiscus syriacus]|uniref:CCT domain-containing protein n=1 Tax=Hibiscus syriacus TaxID=106335 RepID=A0A6A2ZGR0_HIBSY|nr:hypothetical protein F3Y22_tig00110893pilonHSYRG01358 [Hibiscus syriacus]